MFSFWYSLYYWEIDKKMNKKKRDKILNNINDIIYTIWKIFYIFCFICTFLVILSFILFGMNYMAYDILETIKNIYSKIVIALFIYSIFYMISSYIIENILEIWYIRN